MKTTIRKAYNAATGGNAIAAAILLAISIFATLPALLRAQEPPQIAQYRQQIAQIDNLIAQWNNAIGQWNNYLNNGMVAQFNNDPTALWWYNNDRNYRARVDAFFAQQRQQGAQVIAQGQQALAQLQNDRSWLQWGIQSYYNPGGAGQSTGGTQSTGPAGNAGGTGLLGAGGMQH